MKAQIRIYFSILGFLFADKSDAQIFTIDSIKIDEENSQMSIYSRDLDFKNAKVYVTDVRLPALQATIFGYIYQLPDSGDGSAGNISIFSHGVIDSNWKITRWTEDINSVTTFNDTFYYKYGPGVAGYPHIKRGEYHFIFRTTNQISSHIINAKLQHFNRLSYVNWDFNDLLILTNRNLSEEYSGSGRIPIDITEKSNFLNINQDSIYLSCDTIKNLPCSHSFYVTSSFYVIDKGNDTPYLDLIILGLQLIDSNSIIPGQRSQGALYRFWDSSVVKSISWSNLTSESPFVSPSSISAVSAAIDNTSALLQNYPNPFALSTTIPFTLEEGTQISIDILDPLGRICTSLVKGYYDAGSHEVKFNAENFSFGVYFVRMRTENQIFTKPILITK